MKKKGEEKKQIACYICGSENITAYIYFTDVEPIRPMVSFDCGKCGEPIMGLTITKESLRFLFTAEDLAEKYEKKPHHESWEVGKNPSYNKTLPIKDRLMDYLGKLHLVLHGVKAHEPFDLRYENKPNEMCDSDDKKELVEFVELLISQTRKEAVREVLRQLNMTILFNEKREMDDGILDWGHELRVFIRYQRKALDELLKKI